MNNSEYYEIMYGWPNGEYPESKPPDIPSDFSEERKGKILKEYNETIGNVWINNIPNEIVIS